MSVFAEIIVPPELVAVIVTAMGALVYVVRTLVARRAAPEEQVRIAILEVVRTIDKRVREVYAQIAVLPKTSLECPWAGGKIPEHYERFVRSVILELENARLKAGGHQKSG